MGTEDKKKEFKVRVTVKEKHDDLSRHRMCTCALGEQRCEGRVRKYARKEVNSRDNREIRLGTSPKSVRFTAR